MFFFSIVKFATQLMTTKFSWLMCYIIWIVASVESAVNDPSEARILTEIVGNYGAKSRPQDLTDPEKPTIIEIDIAVTKLISINQVEQEMAIAAVMFLDWTDPRLTWNTSDYDNCSFVTIPIESVWYPNVAHHRSADGDYNVGFGGRQLIEVRHDGHVFWRSAVILRSTCELDVTRFPFDQQSCEQVLITWPDMNKVRLKFTNTTQGTRWMYENSEWEVTKFERKQIVFPTPSIWIESRFIYKLNRKSRYYVQTVVIPSAVLTVMVFMVFLLPADAGEKLSFGITVLLTFSVFQLMLSDTLPKTSEFYPIIGNAISMLQFMSAISIVVSTLVLDVHHHGAVVGGRMPKYFHYFVFNILVYATISRKQIKQKAAAIRSGCNKFNNVSPDGMFTDKKISNEIRRGSLQKDPECMKKDLKSSEIIEKLTILTDKLRETDHEESVNLEWKLAALVIDRFLLVVAVFVMVITVIVMCAWV